MPVLLVAQQSGRRKFSRRASFPVYILTEPFTAVKSLGGEPVGKDSFVFYLDWIDHLSILEPEDAMRVLRAIQGYLEGKDADSLSGAAAMAFSFIKAQIERDRSKWEDTRKKRAEAGRLGAQVTNERQKAANPANADFDEQKQQKAANPAVPVPVPVPVPVNVPVIERGADKPPRSRFVPPTVEEVKAYCVENGYKIDAESFVSFYASKGWMIGKSPMKSWKHAVITWKNRERPEGVQKEYADVI